MPFTPRASGSLLSAVIYNADHSAHDTDLQDAVLTLNTTLATQENLALTNNTIADHQNLAALATNVSWVKGFRGNSVAGLPTRFDLFFDKALLQPFGAQPTSPLGIGIGPGTLSCFLGVAGPTANGRDQATAFTTPVFVHLYVIRHAATGTLASLASLGVPETGPTALPSGYTHYAYLTTIRFGAGSVIDPCHAHGSQVFYHQSANKVILANGTATSFTTLSLGLWVPFFQTQLAWCRWEASVSSAVNTSKLSIEAHMRPTGSTDANGLQVLLLSNPGDAAVTYETSMLVPCLLNASGQLDYQILISFGHTGNLDIEVAGYSVPNGDSN